jgi:hypothetical protein
MQKKQDELLLIDKLSTFQSILPVSLWTIVVEFCAEMFIILYRTGERSRADLCDGYGRKTLSEPNELNLAVSNKFMFSRDRSILYLFREDFVGFDYAKSFMCLSIKTWLWSSYHKTHPKLSLWIMDQSGVRSFFIPIPEYSAVVVMSGQHSPLKWMIYFFENQVLVEFPVECPMHYPVMDELLKCSTHHYDRFTKCLMIQFLTELSIFDISDILDQKKDAKLIDVHGLRRIPREIHHLTAYDDADEANNNVLLDVGMHLIQIFTFETHWRYQTIQDFRIDGYGVLGPQFRFGRKWVVLLKSVAWLNINFYITIPIINVQKNDFLKSDSKILKIPSNKAECKTQLEKFLYQISNTTERPFSLITTPISLNVANVVKLVSK